MSKRKLELIVYIILGIICAISICYQVWKEHLDVTYKQQVIEMSEETNGKL